MERLRLVLLPGLDGTDIFFGPLLAALPGCVRPLPLTYPDEGPFDYAALLARARERLRGESACLVLGASFSGPLAVMLAAAEPEKIRGVILCATFLRAPRRWPAVWRLLARTPVVFALRAARRLPVWILRPNHDALRQAKSHTWSKVSASALTQRARSVLSVDVREAFGCVLQPVLCIAYADDRVVASRYCEEMHERLPGLRRITLPGGHLGMFSHPEALAAEITRFMSSLTSS